MNEINRIWRKLLDDGGVQVIILSDSRAPLVDPDFWKRRAAPRAAHYGAPEEPMPVSHQAERREFGFVYLFRLPVPGLSQWQYLCMNHQIVDFPARSIFHFDVLRQAIAVAAGADPDQLGVPPRSREAVLRIKDTIRETLPNTATESEPALPANR